MYTGSSRYYQNTPSEQLSSNEAFYAQQNQLPPSPYNSVQDMVESMEREKMLAAKGTDITEGYDPAALVNEDRKSVV